MTDNIYTALLAIQKRMPRIAKDGTMELGGSKKLKYLAIDDILDKTKPIFDDEGVLVLPSLVSTVSKIKYGQEPPSKIDPARWSGRIPTKSVRVEVEYDFKLVHAESGTSETVRVSGEAMDSQDKATQKAFTSAYKSMLIKSFMLITGDPELEEDQGQDEKQETEQKRNSGQQKVDGARPAAKRSVSTDPRPKAEPAAPVDEKDGATPIQLAKFGLRDAVQARKDAGVPLSPEEVDNIARPLVKKERAQWITSITDIKKITKEIERLTKSGEAPE